MTLPPHVVDNPRLGTWLHVADDVLHVQVGKVELGQGILTALQQLAADALGVPVDGVRMVAAHTTHGPDQGVTAGSLSVLQSAPALRHLGGVVRALAGPVDEGYVARVAALDPGTDLTTVTPAPALPPAAVGCDVPRLDLPDKVLGRPRYLTDLRPDGLLHGRVLRPPRPGATLASVADGVPGLVRDGSFVGVVAEREADVDRALETLRRACAWQGGHELPDEDHLPHWLRSGDHEDVEVLDEGGPLGGLVGPAGRDTPTPEGHFTERPAGPTYAASYSKPFLAHASIAPSAGMARWDDAAAALQVWSHSQAVHALRDALAVTLGVTEVEVQHVEHAGCYGHNAADDAALDAALLARAHPGRPVLVRWSRADELTWAPLSPPMTATLGATLEGGRITSWRHETWSLGHSARPGYRGAPGLLAGAHLADPVALPPSTDPPAAAGHGSMRNGVPAYDVGPRRVVGRRRTDSPLRTSAMRALGAYLNVFAIESFVDELALEAGADPLDFRLAHLADERARHVLREAARLGGWGEALPEGRGRGLGFARYKDRGAYCAVVAEVEAEADVRVRRLTVVADVGLAVAPEGARNQLEGGAVQATSWTVKERVRFDRTRITSDDWESYPILRFAETPEVTAHLVGSDAPPVGAGEAAQGPTAAAIANAVHDALGVRVRDLPLDAAGVVRAIEST